MRIKSIPARPTGRALAILMALSVLVLAACGDDETEPATGQEGSVTESPAAPSPTEETTSAVPSPTEEPADEGGDGDIKTLVAELESCLNDGGIETKSEISDLASYGEKATVDLTFEYGQLTVPGAVTLWVYESEEAAAKGKKEIDKDLLEGDTKTLLRGQVVVDDFGNTLEEPEAADQVEVLDSCTA